MVVLCPVVLLAAISRPANDRVSLAGWATDQNPWFGLVQAGLENAIETFVALCGTQFELLRLLFGVPPSISSSVGVWGGGISGFAETVVFL
ncbi:hypothetical protein FQZ97_1110390 [compost metagenome]